MNNKELQAARIILIGLQKRLVREVDMSEEALREDVHRPGELSNVPTHPADHDAEGMDQEIAIAQNEEQMLVDVEDALARIDAGTYGVCQDCGRDIGRERLKAIPYASRCVKCAAAHDTQSSTATE